ncbi:MAG: hypothetical protein WDM89_01230 [Rhizomicrobium sp.]
MAKEVSDQQELQSRLSSGEDGSYDGSYTSEAPSLASLATDTITPAPSDGQSLSDAELTDIASTITNLQPQTSIQNSNGAVGGDLISASIAGYSDQDIMQHVGGGDYFDTEFGGWLPNGAVHLPNWADFTQTSGWYVWQDGPQPDTPPGGPLAININGPTPVESLGYHPLDKIELALTGASFAPSVVGSGFALAGAGYSAYNGEYIDAGISLAAAVLGVVSDAGVLRTAGKLGSDALKETKTIGSALVPRGASPLGKWGEIKLSQYLGGAGIKPSRPFMTPLGPRYVDRLVDGIAYESKAGINATLDAKMQVQINKDVALVNSGQVVGVEWHFWQGASPQLLQALQRAGIKYVIH